MESCGNGQGQQCGGVHAIAAVPVQRPVPAQLVRQVGGGHAVEALQPSFQSAVIGTAAMHATQRIQTMVVRAWVIRGRSQHGAAIGAPHRRPWPGARLPPARPCWPKTVQNRRSVPSNCVRPAPGPVRRTVHAWRPDRHDDALDARVASRRRHGWPFCRDAGNRLHPPPHRRPAGDPSPGTARSGNDVATETPWCGARPGPPPGPGLALAIYADSEGAPAACRSGR